MRNTMDESSYTLLIICLILLVLIYPFVGKVLCWFRGDHVCYNSVLWRKCTTAAVAFPDWLKKFTTNLEIPSNNEEELPIENNRYIEELLSVLVKAPNHTVFVLIDKEPYSISLSDNQEIVVKKLDK